MGVGSKGAAGFLVLAVSEGLNLKMRLFGRLSCLELPPSPPPPVLSTLISSSQACIYLVPSTELSTQQAFPKQPGHINHPSLPGKGHLLLQSHPRVTRQPCTGSAEETHKNLWNEFISPREFLPVRVGAKVDDLGRGAGP